LKSTFQYFEHLSLKKAKIYFQTCLLCLIFSLSKAQNMQIKRQLNWEQNQFSDGNFQFEGCILDPKTKLPFFSEVIDLNGVEVASVQFFPKEINSNSYMNEAVDLPSNFHFNYYIRYARKKPQLIVNVFPIQKKGAQIQTLASFEIAVKTKTSNQFQTFKKSVAHSVLSKGNWFKIGTTQNGIFRIDYNALKNMGINPDQINPKQIQLYGNGAGMLPTANNALRYDDLHEIPIQVKGESDGKFNTNDFILFYGQSQIDHWIFNQRNSQYEHVSNLYSDTVYYFLTIGNNAGKRIQLNNQTLVANAETDNSDFTYLYEQDKVNLTKSGKVWLGEEFSRVPQQSFGLSIPNLNTNENIYLKSTATGRAIASSNLAVGVNGNTILTHSLSPVTGGYDRPYACPLNSLNTTFKSNTNSINLSYSYQAGAPGGMAWLDYFEIQARQLLRNNTGNFIIKDKQSIGTGKTTKFNITSGRNLSIWDVSNPVEPFEIPTQFTNNSVSFIVNTDSLRTFCAFDGSNFFQVKPVGKIPNQDLHAQGKSDGIIVYHPDFSKPAARLAKYHSEKNGYKIHLVNIQEIYNEFAGGSCDVSAVRDFLKLLYNNAASPADFAENVLLFGRASYDYKNRTSNNSNFIPVFESTESFDPTESYCSDDYTSFLDDNEGLWDTGSDNGELMDIGLGRLPVSNETEAEALVDKLISYSDQNAFGDWRNTVVFMADDEDYNIHQNQSNTLANNLFARYPTYNIKKIFLDAYPREVTSGGARYPEANKAMNNAIDKGCLLFNYTGHGGEVGLTAERVLGLDDINNWKNANRLPLFLTATCEFSRFDDPERVSAGEQVLLHPNGGGIGLFTTVRLVFSGQNEVLNRKFYEQVGLDSLSQLNPKTLGNVLMLTKNAYLDKNTRNFTYLGDPFLKLAFPKQGVVVSTINKQNSNEFKDTLKAFEKIEIEGFIRSQTGQINTNFNGEIFPVIFDKPDTFNTLVNNPLASLPMSFQMQSNVIYRGRASVNSGKFSFNFIVPKDISYQVGFGKFSAYAKSDSIDATGFSNKILIGGTSDSMLNDKDGPELKLYLNSENFVNGSITDERPLFIAKLFDLNGINTTGRGIGRDLSMVIDNDQSKRIVLNDYYQAQINDYQKGELRYQFKDMKPGKHTLVFRAFDVLNNVSESSIEFEVKQSTATEIKNLLNYPNPFTNATVFHFDHNQSGQAIQASIQVFTVEGRLVKTLLFDGIANGNHFDQLSWNGKDEFGDQLAKGVYIYKAKLKVAGLKTVEQYQKLLLLN